MITPKPTRSESTFTSNKEVKRLSGYSDQKREGVRDVSIALYDVDYAVKWHLENIVQPTITEENSVITVPIIFASGEKWAAVQKHGYLRDNQGKLLTPLIAIRRNSISRREDIQDLKVLETADARILFEKKYSKQNRYDRFNLTNKTPRKEYYSMDVPKYVQVEYDLVCWTNNTVQLNEIVEQLIWFDGKAFGDTYKFITHIDPPSFETVNTVGEDRLVRATLSMRTKAQILNTHGPNAPSLYKINPVTRLVVAIETDTGIELTGTSLQTAPSNVTIVGPSGGGGGFSITPADVLTYFNTNRQLTGTVASDTSVIFASGWLEAPSLLPDTNIDNFIFFVNGVLLERTAIISFTESMGSSILIISPSQLGYSLKSGDEVIGIGKFINQDS